MGLGISLQVSHARGGHPPFARVFDRLPVLVGRDGAVASCVLPDERISRVHVSFDIRDGYLVVRDAGSTNGTLVSGNRIPTDRWLAAGPVATPVEVRIAEWILLVGAREIVPPSVATGGEFLPALPPEPPAPPPGPGGEGQLAATMASGEPLDPSVRARLQAKTQVTGSALRVARAWAQIMGLRNELVTAVAEAVEGLPPAERAAAARALLQTCAGIEREPGVRAILERNGVAAPHTTETAAAHALQELARWYVGTRPLASPEEVLAFARKLKLGIDELLLGILPMFSGLDRFEQQMALRPPGSAVAAEDMAPSSRLPRAPRDAARELFDWADRSDSALRAIRTDIVDLTMHQVAVLNGVMRGVKQLLFELSPAAVEKMLAQGVARRGLFDRLFGSRAAALWKIYRQRHGDLADEENEQFRVIFGPEFAAEYKASSAETGAPTPARR